MEIATKAVRYFRTAFIGVNMLLWQKVPGGIWLGLGPFAGRPRKRPCSPTTLLAAAAFHCLLFGRCFFLGAAHAKRASGGLNGLAGFLGDRFGGTLHFLADAVHGPRRSFL